MFKYLVVPFESEANNIVYVKYDYVNKDLQYRKNINESWKSINSSSILEHVFERLTMRNEHSGGFHCDVDFLQRYFLDEY